MEVKYYINLIYQLVLFRVKSKQQDYMKSLQIDMKNLLGFS